MWVTVEPGNVCEGRFEAAQLDAAHTVWRWQAGDSMSGGAQHSGITMTHDEAWREAMAAVERAKGAEALDAARAEGEAAGYRRAIDDACGLLDEPHRSTVRALAPQAKDGTP
jgi:hypothetical protein